MAELLAEVAETFGAVNKKLQVRSEDWRKHWGTEWLMHAEWTEW